MTQSHASFFACNPQQNNFYVLTADELLEVVNCELRSADYIIRFEGLDSLNEDQYAAMLRFVNKAVKVNAFVYLVCLPYAAEVALRRDYPAYHYRIASDFYSVLSEVRKHFLVKDFTHSIQVFRWKLKKQFLSLYAKLMLGWVWLFFSRFCRGVAEDMGLSEEEKTRGFIVAPNHSGKLAWLFLYQYFRKKEGISLRFLVPEAVFRDPVWSALARHAGCIMISDDGKRVLDPAGNRMIKCSKHIAIFSENGGYASRSATQANTNVIKFAKQLSLPILPTALRGFDKAWSTPYLLPRRRPWEVAFGVPMTPVDECSLRDLHALMSVISSLLKDDCL